jgi:hypothetical protein
LRHTDPLLRAAASWSYSIEVMKEFISSADVTTRYEDLVLKPEQELRHVTLHVGLTLSPEAIAIPRWRKEEFRVARYLLRRSPMRREAMQLVEPAALEFGYPAYPEGFPGDDRLFAFRYLLTVLRRPHKTPPYAVPWIAKVAGAALRRVRART